jgi:replicative DNA helicase
MDSIHTKTNRLDTKLKETLQILNIEKHHLPQETQYALSQLSGLAMVLGVTDTQLSTLHQGLAQSHIETTHWQTLQHPDHFSLLESLDRYLIAASQDLAQLRELKRQLEEHRSTVGDIEFRTRRRSAELTRIKTKEDKNQLQELYQSQQRNGLDVEAQGLTVAQLDQQEQEVAELVRQVDVQTKSLTSYQAIPPVSHFSWSIRSSVEEGLLSRSSLIFIPIN